MMTPEAIQEVLEEVREMLARAKPTQTRRLLDDVARIPAKESVKYDA